MRPRDNLKPPRAEIRQHNLAAGLHHPQHFPQHLPEIRDVMHGVHGDRRIKSFVRPRQPARIPQHELNLPFHARIPCVEAGASLFLG